MNTESLKLFKVNLKGPIKRYGTCYVVSTDPTAAYRQVRDFLDKEKYGFTAERELVSVELIGEDDHYTDVGARLFIGRSITADEANLLSEIYGKLWIESHYDPTSEATQKFAEPLTEKIMKLNETLKFRT